MTTLPIRVLFVEDDEEDLLLIRDMLSEVRRNQFQISWASTYPDGMTQILQDQFDVALIDYSLLGKKNGLNFIREAITKGVKTPMIMVTGHGDYEVDMEAMQAGAGDYLSKSELKSTSLERAIRYAIERKRSEEESAARALEMEMLVRIAAAVRSATTPAQMYPLILDQLMKWMKVDGAAIALPDVDRGEVIFQVGTGNWLKITGESLPHGTGITGRVLSTGEPYVNNEIQKDPDLIKTFFFKTLSCGACIPLNTHQQTIGVIWVGRLKPITDEEIRLLTAIADMAASAIYRATLFEQTKLRLQRLSSLHTIDQTINASLDLRLTSNIFLEQVVTQLDVHAADLLQFDRHAQKFVHLTERGFQPGELTGQLQTMLERFARQAFLERKLIILPELQKHLEAQATSLASTTADLGMGNFAAVFAAPLIAKGKVKGVLEVLHRAPIYPDSEWLDFLQTLAAQGAIAMENAELFEELQRMNEQLTVSYDETIKGWSRAIDLRDRETYGHSERVALYTVQLARQIGIPEAEFGHIQRGALLHDIGKMAIPDVILHKPGPLDENEWFVMRQHPIYAYELLSPIPYLHPALDIPYCHHERLDGSGYPRGLKGEAIPLAARLFAVIDVWDAMRSDRPYRTAISAEKTAEYISSQAGIKFDPQVVSIFLQMVDKSFS